MILSMIRRYKKWNQTQKALSEKIKLQKADLAARETLGDLGFKMDMAEIDIDCLKNALEWHETHRGVLPWKSKEDDMGYEPLFGVKNLSSEFQRASRYLERSMPDLARSEDVLEQLRVLDADKAEQIEAQYCPVNPAQRHKELRSDLQALSEKAKIVIGADIALTPS